MYAMLTHTLTCTRQQAGNIHKKNNIRMSLIKLQFHFLSHANIDTFQSLFISFVLQHPLGERNPLICFMYHTQHMTHTT